MNGTSPIVIRLLGVAGFAAMACAGWKLADGPATAEAANAEAAAAPAKAATRTGRVARNAGPPPQVSRKLAAIRNAGNPKERMRATLALVYSLPAAELGEWIDKRWFESVPGFDLTLFNKIANQRWREEDPEGMLKWALESGDNSAYTVVEELTRSNPEQLLAYFRGHPSSEMEMNALRQIAETRPELALAHLQESLSLGNSDSSGGYYISEILRAAAEKSPALVKAAMEKLPAREKSLAEAVLIGQGLKSDFSSEIRKLWERPDSMKLFEMAMNGMEGSEKIGDMILADLGSLPASWRNNFSRISGNLMSEDNAEQWFRADLAGAGFTPEQAKGLRLEAMGNLSYEKPKEAIALLRDFELDPEQRREMVMNLFGYQREGIRNEDLLALLPSDEDRANAREVMDRAANHSEDDGSKLKAETPAEWLELAGATKANSSSDYYMRNILSNWSKEKIDQLASEFRSMPADKKLAVATMLASDYDTRSKNPELRGDAIRYLVETPGAEPPPNYDAYTLSSSGPSANSRSIQLASSHAVYWGLQDPDAASRWVQTLPGGEAKLWAQKNLARNWAQYDPEAAQRWVSGMPADSRAEVEKFMKEKR